MKITDLRIKNFRAIKNLHLSGLQDAVLIAGTNGCGKSSILEALKFLKSAYGEYNSNEYASWLQENQINRERIASDMGRLFNNTNSPISICADVVLSSSEISYLLDNGKAIYREMSIHRFAGKDDGEQRILTPSNWSNQAPMIERQAAALFSKLELSLKKSSHTASVQINTNGVVSVESEATLELVFGIYAPGHLGVFEYHAPNRFFSREGLSNINFNFEPKKGERTGQFSLYNTGQKYAGIKSELAESYLKNLIVERAVPGLTQDVGETHPAIADLNQTLDELFAAFAPGKRFLGVTPTPQGGLEFPVKLPDGKEHDINDLSSGEKEVLLGYLRLRAKELRHSILLFDEPELHLNPRLAGALPRFYQRHLGQALCNQIWLVTHSDAILRKALEEPSYSVFHMQSAFASEGTANQATRVSATEEVESAIIDIVGDLATYNPRSKIVLVEGSDSGADAKIISELFPLFAERVNLVPMGSKSRVELTRSLLEQAGAAGRIDARFFSIVDRDFDETPVTRSENNFSWDVYHIENFLLEPRFIGLALRSLRIGEADPSDEFIAAQLEAAARETVDDMILIQLRSRLNSDLIQCISLNFDPKLGVEEGLSEAVDRSAEQIQNVKHRYTLAEVRKLGEESRSALRQALLDESWKKKFRGRDILKRLVSKMGLGISYDTFRNLVVNSMRDKGFQPSGMDEVLSKILRV